MQPGSIVSYCADILERLEHQCIRVLSLGLIVVVFGGVLLRYVFRIPVVWGEELAMFTFMWLAFLCASVAVRRKAHFRMSALIDMLPAKPRAALEVGTLVIMGILTAVLAWQGIHFMLAGLKEQAPGLRVPMAWAYAAVPISAISMLVFLAEAILMGPRSQGEP